MRLGPLKTTIDVPDELYTDFSVKVRQEKGPRENNNVIVKLMKLYTKGAVKVD